MQKKKTILFLLSFVLNFILFAENENIETIINANNGGSIKVETQQKVTVQALATPIKIFKKWSDGKLYNFYSSTEDVLRKYNDDSFIFDGAGSNFGQYS